MKTLNVRLALTLLGVVLAVAITISLLYSFQKRRNAYVFLQLAQEAQQSAESAKAKGNLEQQKAAYKEAIQNFQWYTNLVPDDVDAMEEFGLLLADLGDYEGAFGTLEKVLRQSPDRANTRRRLVEVAALHLGRFSDATEHLQGYLLQRWPNNGELLTLLGMCQAASNANNAAVATLQRAIENGPDQIQAYQWLAMILESRTRTLDPALEATRLTQADQCMGKLIQANPNSSRAHLAYAQYVTDLMQIRSTDETWKHPILRSVMVPTVLDESIRHAVDALALPPDDPDAKLLAANHDLLIQALRQSLKIFRSDLAIDDPDALLRAAGTGARPETPDPARLTEAADKALKDLQPQLQADDNQALDAAQKRGLLADAMKSALEGFDSRNSLLQASRFGVVDEAMTHVLVARNLVSENTRTLSQASERGILADALKQAAAAQDPDVLRFDEKDTTLTDALKRATDALKLPADDPDLQLLVKKRSLLVDALKQSLHDRDLASDDRARVQKAVEGEALPRVLKRVLEAREAARGADDRMALLLAAQCAVWRGRYDEARQQMQQGIKLYPKEANLYSTLAEIEMRDGKREQAIECLQKGLVATNRSPLLLWRLARLLTDAGETQSSKKIIDELAAAQYPPNREMPPPTVAADFLRARLDFAQNRWLTSSQKFEKIRDRLTEWPELLKLADFSLGKCYGQLGNTDRQMDAMRRVINLDPFFRPALASLADSLMRTGKIEDATAMYRRLSNLGEGGDVALARTLIMGNLRLPAAQRNWTEVEAILKRASQETPDSSQVAVLQAEFLFLQNRADEAQKVLQEAWGKNPKDVDLFSALVAVDLLQQQWDRLEAHLKEAEGKIEDPTAILLARTTYESQRYPQEAGPRIAAAVKQVEQLPEADRSRALNGLLSIALQSPDDQQKREICERLLKLDPANLRLQTLLFDLLIGAKDKDVAGMEKVRAQLEKIEGRGPHWLYASAVLLSLAAKDGQDPRLDEALKLLAQARQQQPSWGHPVLLEAAIYDRQGKPQRAIEGFAKAIDLGEGNPWAFSRMVDLLTQAGRYAEAEQMLGRLKERQETLSTMDLRREGEIKSMQGDLEGALAIAQKVTADSDKYQDHVWLGRLLALKGQRAETDGKIDEARQLVVEAEKSFRRAVELDDKTADTWVPLIYFLNGTKQTQSAEEALDAAAAKIPRDKAPLAMARCYEAMDRMDQAQKAYESALAAAPDDLATLRQVIGFYIREKKPQPARALLQKIVAGKLASAKPEDLLWARRSLVGFVVDRSDYANLQQSIGLIRQNLAAGSADEDVRLLASLLARDPKQSQQLEAIKLLESIAVPSADDQLALARLYVSAGNWAKGGEQYRRLVAAFGNDPRYLAAYIDALLKHDELANAESYLNSLAKIVPWQFGTVSLQADLLFRRKQYAQVLDLLNRYVGRNDALPADGDTRVGLTAAILDQFVQRAEGTPQDAAAVKGLAAMAAEAERLYRSYVIQRPEQRMSLAAFLARQGKIDDALDIIEASAADTQPEALAQLLSILLKSAAANKAQVQRAEALLQAALKSHPRSVPLLVATADIRSYQNRNQEAEAIYRDILKIDKTNGVVKNNLAVLLALQKIKLDESLKLVDEAIASAGPVGAMLDSRATVYMALAQPDKALADLNEAIGQAATAVRLFHQAQAYDQLGRQPEAAASLGSAHELGLTADMLPALERPAYQQLKKKLKAG